MVRLQQKYLREALQQAIKAYSNGSMSSVEAAKHFGVPQSTIRNHKRQPPISIGSGLPYLLTKIDEDHLVQLFLDLEQTGFRLTKSKMMKIARDYVTTQVGHARP